MKSYAERYKPAAPAAVHLLLAALLWTGVGLFLLSRAVTALGLLAPLPAAVGVAAALALGGLKGWKVMRPAAVKGVARIVERGDGRCLGGFLSWKSWAFVLGMMLLGRWMRSAGLPPLLLVIVLGGVGLALLWGSAVFWKAFAGRRGVG